MTISEVAQHACICMPAKTADNDIARAVLLAGGPNKVRDGDKVYFLRNP
jgi:hypothetical protein